MPRKHITLRILVLFVLVFTAAAVSAQALSTSEFTYQGQLSYQGALANGSFDFQFKLFSSQAGVTQIGSTNTSSGVQVSDGLFTTQLDFGADTFEGSSRWLEISVRLAGSGAYTTLSPRQEITPTPYSIFSGNTAALQSYPVDTAAPASGEALVWNGTDWAPTDISAAVAGNYWGLLGNASTTYGTNFIGTTDDAALDFRVNNLSALRIFPHATSPNLIGGYSGNTVGAGVYGATISGGGASGNVNTASGNYCTIGGGRANEASGTYSAIGGGEENTASGDSSTVAGGENNTASSDFSTVGGGQYNKAETSTYATVGGGQGNTADGKSSTIGGGSNNSAKNWYATVSGGYSNDASAENSTISGGYDNEANGDLSTVGGGAFHTASGKYSTIDGGQANETSGSYSSIDGGRANVASGSYSTIGGGEENIASGGDSTVGGGENNTASGDYSTIPGGHTNTADGSYSFAAGHSAKASHSGTFVWADSNANDVTSTADNQFVVGAQAGAHFLFDTDAGATTPGAGNRCDITEAGGVACTSDRNAKENLAAQNGREVLEKLAGMPIYKWNFISDETATTHMGPMAQDFYSSFDVGNSDVMISTIDLDGVSLAAIQGLYEIVQEKDAQLSEQQAQIDDLEARLSRLEATVTTRGSSSMSLSQVWILIGFGVAAFYVREKRQRQ